MHSNDEGRRRAAALNVIPLMNVRVIIDPAPGSGAGRVGSDARVGSGAGRVGLRERRGDEKETRCELK